MSDEKTRKVVYHGVPHKIYIVPTQREFNIQDGDVFEVNEIEFKELMLKNNNDSQHKFEEYKGKSKTSGGDK